MIERRGEIETILSLLGRYPVVGLIGARQVGKTTLARLIIKKTKRETHYFDLENPEHLARLADPMLALKDLKGLVVIDEVQSMPELFKVLRVLVDRPRQGARFLVLGSASPELIRKSAETLAGRIIYHELKGFSLEEIGVGNFSKLWLRGGFPRSYLARTNRQSYEWRKAFIRTFLERDIPQLGITIRSTTLRRFWMMLAHWHGQLWNASEFGRSFGVSDTTVRNYLDILTGALVIRQLLPWHENISKRQVKAQKVYVADTGLLHSLLGIRSLSELESHPKVGASWEGFVIEQTIQILKARADECFFWATHGGAELDLLVIRGRKRFGFEVKRTSSPEMTPSMRYAMSDLRLDFLDVIHAGDQTFQMGKRIRAVSFKRLLKDIKPLS